MNFNVENVTLLNFGKVPQGQTEITNQHTECYNPEKEKNGSYNK